MMKISKSKIKSDSTTEYFDDNQYNGTSILSASITSLLMFSSYTALAQPVNIDLPDSQGPLSIPSDKFKQLNQESQTHQADMAQEALVLQAMFGLNTAQLAALLSVERKTIYNWKKSPQTQLQERNIQQITALKMFSDIIEQEHAPWFGKLLFGRQADSQFANEFMQSLQSSTDLEVIYDKYYTAIDGFVKRQLREQRNRKV